MTSAIIVAAGKSTRMGKEVDKLFLPVAGRPLIAHTWGKFDASPVIDEIVLVVREEREPAFRELAVEFNFRKPHRFVPGGAERQDSVWNGLTALTHAAEVVAIQDGARPCTSLETIAQAVRWAGEIGAAVAAQRIVDTIKQSEDGEFIQQTIDRSKLWAVQTPQAFRLEIIRRALQAVRDSGRHVTDDTAACELIGQPVRLVETPQPNPKATSPADVAWIELLLRLETVRR